MLASVGAVLITLLNSSVARAYSVTFNGRTAGDPPGQLRDIHLHSGDIGRTLDPTTWSLSAGTKNKDGDTLTENIVGQAVITVLNLTAEFLELSFEVANLTNPTSQGYKAAIVGLWFGVTPDATKAELNGGTTFKSSRVDPNGNAPGGFKDIDICIYAANNCQGGNINRGLQIGQVDNFKIKIFGDFGVYDSDNTYLHSAVTISDFGTKWQTTDGSYAVAGVPEPMTILGSGAALGFGAFMKRRSSKKRAGKS